MRTIEDKLMYISLLLYQKVIQIEERIPENIRTFACFSLSKMIQM